MNLWNSFERGSIPRRPLISKKAVKWSISGILIFWLLDIAFISIVILVAWHFIAKFW